MYSYVATQNAILKNSVSRSNPKTEYFNEQTKKLIAKGYSRSNARAIIKQALDKTGDIGPGAFTQKNLRKTRRARSKRLKVPFQPAYNGPLFKVVWIKDEEGNWLQELQKA
jgi:hypothetical protein